MNEVQTIRRSLSTIERMLKRLGRKLREAGKQQSGGPRRRLRLSPQRRAALKLQGRYLGYMRQLKPRQKAKVKALKASRGYHAAIKMARRLAGR